MIVVGERDLLSVCVCTCRRAQGLADCLDSLARIRMPAGQRAEVLVVDNDASASAQAYVVGAARSYPHALRYFCEPRTGVSHARNRCLQEACGEWVAFVDDDEVVECDWLSAAWSQVRSGDVDGVFGPVIAQFAQVPDEGLLASGAHQRPRFSTGTLMRWGDCRSGNVIFRRRLFVDNGGFDPRYAASGGEDCDFFWRCQARGARLVWCNEAIVRERVPASRMTRGWVLRRAFNGGRTFARLRATRCGLRSYVSDALWGMAGVLLYAVPAVAARCLRHQSALRFERKVAGGLGKIVAPFASAQGGYSDVRSRWQLR